jgi:hypothetical protein
MTPLLVLAALTLFSTEALASEDVFQFEGETSERWFERYEDGCDYPEQRDADCVAACTDASCVEDCPCESISYLVAGKLTADEKWFDYDGSMLGEPDLAARGEVLVPTEGMDAATAMLAYRSAVARGFTLVVTDPEDGDVLDVVQIEHARAFDFKPNFGADAKLIRSVLKMHLDVPERVVRITIGLNY